jgi:hypothetical protein
MSGRIKCNGHNLDNCKTYKIKDEKYMRHEIKICDECEHVHCKKGMCKNCYGKIIVSEKQNFKKKKNDIAIISTIYRDYYVISKEGNIVDSLDASLFFNSSHSITNKKTGIQEQIKDIVIEHEVIDFDECVGSLHLPLLSADHPSNWKTICQSCKDRYKKNNLYTPCELAKKYMENIVPNVNNASSKEILSIELPENCICRERFSEKFREQFEDDNYLQPEKLQEIH